MTNQFAVAIIGGGPAGYVAAAAAAKYGLSVALIEKAHLGGTCLNCGCIPSKALLESTEKFPTMPLMDMMARKQKIVEQLRDGIAQLLDHGQVTIFHGEAGFVSSGRLQISGNKPQTITATDIIIACGSKPSELPFAPFGDNIISSTSALELPAIPPDLAIIGGGAIGLELGTVWARLGSKVTILEMLPQIGGQTDKQLAMTLERLLKKQGLDIKTSCQVKAVRQEGQQVAIDLCHKGSDSTLLANKLLVAAGRTPNTAKLLASLPELVHDQRGFIQVDENFATSVPHVWAIGDCIGGAMLAHKAEDEGRAVINKLVNNSTKVQKLIVPSVIYTHPELAQIGLTEAKAKEEGITCKCGKSYFAANGRALSMDQADGLLKVVADADTDIILGVQILGPLASELIGEATLAVTCRLTCRQLVATCHAHPTLSEALRAACLNII